MLSERSVFLPSAVAVSRRVRHFPIKLRVHDVLSVARDNPFHVYLAVPPGRCRLFTVGLTADLPAAAPLQVVWFETLGDYASALALAQRMRLWPQPWRLAMVARTNPGSCALAG